MRRIKILFVLIAILFAGCIHNSKQLNYPINVEPNIENSNAITVANLLFKMKANSYRRFYYKFAPGDTIVVNAWTIKGDNISNFNVEMLPFNNVYNTYAAKTILNEKIVNKRKAIYKFTISNTSLFSTKMYKLMIYRIPKFKAFENFNTTVYWDTVYDTTYVTQRESVLVDVDSTVEIVLSTRVQLPPMKKSYMEVNLPENTLFWVYWIGATGSEKTPVFSDKKINIPLRSYALGKIPGLKVIKKGAPIDYYFIRRYTDVEDFMNGFDFRYFKSGISVVSDYAKIDSPAHGKFYIALHNKKGNDKFVHVKIFALIGTPHYEYDYITVPRVRVRYIPHM